MKLGYLASFVKTKLYLVFYSTILYRLGFGQRVGKEVWEKEYKGSTWEFLHSEDELVHYKAVINQVKKVKTPNILDIGCGEGVLYDYFTKSIDKEFKYTGIDISKTAVENATKKYPGIDFKTIDYDFDPLNGKFNLVIFNEVLYYFVKPMKILQKAINENLADDGVVLISMVDDGKGRHSLIWKNIDNNFKVLTEEIVKNSKGWTWTIKTLSPLKQRPV